MSFSSPAKAAALPSSTAHRARLESFNDFPPELGEVLMETTAWLSKLAYLGRGSVANKVPGDFIYKGSDFKARTGLGDFEVYTELSTEQTDLVTYSGTDAGSGIFGFVASSATNNAIYVVYRGTDMGGSDSWKNWIVNLNSLRTENQAVADFKMCTNLAPSGSQGVVERYDDEWTASWGCWTCYTRTYYWDWDTCYVGLGFSSAYDLHRRRMKDAVDTLRKNMPTAEIIVTGHSLGGC